MDKTPEEVARDALGPDLVNGVGYDDTLRWMAKAIREDRRQRKLAQKESE